MATVHNAIRRYQQLQRGVKIALGMDQGEGGIERVGETLTPCYSPWAAPEDAYLRGEQLLLRGIEQAGVAGQIAWVGVTNGSTNRIVVVEGAVYGNTTAINSLNLWTRSPAGAFTSSNAAENRDPRHRNTGFGGAGGTAGRVIAGTAAALGAVGFFGPWFHWVVGPNTNTSAPIPFPSFVLVPNSEVVLAHDTLGAALKVSYWWREREALPGELRS